jgi:two-component system chemotaxis sensor kinase CheA
MVDVGNQNPIPERAQLSAPPRVSARPRGFTLPPPPEPSGITILHKLVGIIVALVVLLVGTLAVYFPARQVGEFHESLANKAGTYSRFLAKQLGPSVAFEDRQTAREVFEAVGEDRDVAAIALYMQDGTALETRGMLAPATVAMLGQAHLPLVTTSGDRIVALAEVVSLEGPRGTLALELSTASLAQARHKALWAGLLVGGCGLLVGCVAAWLIGRSLARRLRAIAEVATAVAAGDLQTKPIRDGGGDEIGAMAHAFHTMLVQLRTLIAQIQKNAKEEQERLEKLVSQRTRELDRRNAEMRLLLDNADQGFLTLDRDAVISRERSASVEKWLSPPPRISFGACVERFVPKFSDTFGADWAQVIANELPLELTLDQLPRSINMNDQHFAIDYRPIFDGGQLDKVLVVISDITAAVARARAEQDEREITHLFRYALEDVGGLTEFIEDTSRLINELTGRAAGADTVLLKRLVHTLKGNAASFGVQTLAAICHDMESSFAVDGVVIRAADRDRLTSRWANICQKLGAIGPAAARNLQVEPTEHEALIRAVDSGASRQDIRRTLESWKLESVEVRFRRIAANIEALAERLGKGPVEVHIESNGIRLPHDGFAPFWQSLTHVVRNAVDHGLESVEDRRLHDKPDAAPMFLRAALTKTTIAIDVEDSGRGIDWNEVKRAARGRGLPIETRHDLVEALFADGVSTRTVTTETSGRGVGLGATRAACRDAGGDVEIWTEPGKGTRFRFIWPRSALGVADHGLPAGDDVSASGYVSLRKGNKVDAGTV